MRPLPNPNNLAQKNGVISALIMILLIGFVSMRPVLSQNGHSDQPASLRLTPEIWGIEFSVSDINQSIDFYTEALGFEINELECCEDARVLKNGPLHLLLTQSDALPSPQEAALVILNIKVGDFTTACEAVRSRGGSILDQTPRRFAHGQYIKIQDPSGNYINLLQLDSDETPAGADPAVYNIGVRQQNLENAEDFYAKLGFVPFSRDYLPEVLPLRKMGAVMLILHRSANSPARNGARNGIIILSTNNLESDIQALASRGLLRAESENDANGKFATLSDPSGNQLKLIQRTASPAKSAASNAPLSLQQEWSALQKEVWRTVEAYAEASHQRDLQKYLSYWHPDFVGWHNGDTRPTTYQQRSNGLRHYFDNTASLEYKLEPMAIQILVDGKAAIVHYKIYNVLQIKKNGSRQSGLSYWTDYLVNENGKWLLISDHGGSVPEEKATGQ